MQWCVVVAERAARAGAESNIGSTQRLRGQVTSAKQAEQARHGMPRIRGARSSTKHVWPAPLRLCSSSSARVRRCGGIDKPGPAAHVLQPLRGQALRNIPRCLIVASSLAADAASSVRRTSGSCELMVDPESAWPLAA
ncbi:hypothetical protein ANO11243_041040 [Dothideomycetidae sp. 11243]|nr:hypothetical protein ANO11243_041040 [fungal sp. No.11243]